MRQGVTPGWREAGRYRTCPTTRVWHGACVSRKLARLAGLDLFELTCRVQHERLRALSVEVGSIGAEMV